MAEKKSILIRLPESLWADIKRWADDDLRSVNAQIEFLLRESVRRRKRQAEPPPDLDDEQPEP
ncbi:MAG: Arc family DNA binding domain-containing protein [Phycisphaerales bacterium]|nr:MAG: Arc family DNA binding domain-containing protein [Phycisphaerales bacterium]